MKDTIECILDFLESVDVPCTESKTSRFHVSDPFALTYLQQNGYVVIKSALNKEEVKKSMSLLWDWLESLNHGIKRDDPETWKDWPGWTSNGLIPCKGIGQSEFLWYIRTRPKVAAAFSSIWATDDLLVSFDGCGLFRPHGNDKEWKTSGGWFHIDQNKHLLPHFACVQGFVSLTKASPESGGLHLYPKSHRHFKSFPANIDQGNFVNVSPECQKRLGAPKLVTCEPGDLVLWDSRVVHCNTPGTGPGEDSKLLRAVAYVCMTPKYKASLQVIEKRKQAVLHGMTLNHWPHGFTGASTGPKIPNGIEINSRMKKLIGYEKNEPLVSFDLQKEWLEPEWGYYRG